MVCTLPVEPSPGWRRACPGSWLRLTSTCSCALHAGIAGLCFPSRAFSVPPLPMPCHPISSRSILSSPIPSYSISSHFIPSHSALSCPIPSHLIYPELLWHSPVWSTEHGFAAWCWGWHCHCWHRVGVLLSLPPSLSAHVRILPAEVREENLNLPVLKQLCLMSASQDRAWTPSSEAGFILNVTLLRPLDLSAHLSLQGPDMHIARRQAGVFVLLWNWTRLQLPDATSTFTAGHHLAVSWPPPLRQAKKTSTLSCVFKSHFLIGTASQEGWETPAEFFLQPLCLKSSLSTSACEEQKSSV